MPKDFKVQAKNLKVEMIINGKVVDKVEKKNGKVIVSWDGISKPSIYYPDEYVK